MVDSPGFPKSSGIDPKKALKKTWVGVVRFVVVPFVILLQTLSHTNSKWFVVPKNVRAVLEVLLIFLRGVLRQRSSTFG